MIQYRWQRSLSMVWSWGGRRGRAARARQARRPIVEAMESRELLSTIAEFPTPTAASRPISMALGSDGNLWFTEFIGNKIGMINPTTHATADFATPTAGSSPYSITAGPDGNLWFTEFNGNKIGSINPTTHAITELTIPTAASEPNEIAAGPDGNLWFTEFNGNKIGMVNPTTQVITEFPVPTATSVPFGIVAGSDGNVWFTETVGNKIGSINPTTHAITEFTIPTASSSPEEITAGSDGNLWFAEYNGNKIGSINPVTHTLLETNLPTAGSSPFGMTSGPDGNVWFTEVIGNRVGSINPITRGITETAVPTAASNPRGITTGPDGNLWFAESDASKLAVLTPTLSLVATAQPPAFVAPNGAFGLTVSAFYQSGVPDTGFNGNVTLALLTTSPGGATLGGTLTAAAHNGVATFSGLTINQAGSYRIMAYTDPLTATLSTPVTVATPPTIVTEKVVFAGQGRRRRVVGYELDFSTAMDPTRAASLVNYKLSQFQRRGRQLITQPVSFQAAYNATAHSVTLTLVGRPRFARGGQLVVVAQPPGGITDAAGAPLDGGNRGLFGDDGTFVIARKGTGISR